MEQPRSSMHMYVLASGQGCFCTRYFFGHQTKILVKIYTYAFIMRVCVCMCLCVEEWMTTKWGMWFTGGGVTLVLRRPTKAAFKVLSVRFRARQFDSWFRSISRLSDDVLFLILFRAFKKLRVRHLEICVFFRITKIILYLARVLKCCWGKCFRFFILFFRIREFFNFPVIYKIIIRVIIKKKTLNKNRSYRERDNKFFTG